MTRRSKSPSSAASPLKLSHVDAATGEARMVDVGAKPVTAREAVAAGRIHISREAMALVKAGAIKKGDPMQVARLAGILGAKQTAALIPLCHPLPLSSVDVTIAPVRDGFAIEGRVRTVAVPIWVKQGVNAWMTAAKIEEGRLLRPLSKSGKILGDKLGDWAIWSVVEQSSKQIGIEHFGAHDLRRTCAKLCRKNGGDLEQIKFLLGHSSIQTTERYLGSDQDIEIAVNDNLGL